MRETYGSNTLDFFYDANGYPYALQYNGTTYYYITNLQGDVMYLIDASENTVAAYEYDPYGNIVSATGSMAEINPIRYRGYYYDAELEMYYLQSRYYDPQIGRFINVDDIYSLGANDSVTSYNLFAYCGNNVINKYDPTGYWHLDLRADALATTIDILIYLLPAIQPINKMLKKFTYIPKYEVKTALSTIRAFLIKVLPRINIGLGVVGQLMDWISDLTGIFPYGASIGGLIVWGLTKIFKTWTTKERAFGWFGPVIKVTYIRIF